MVKIINPARLNVLIKFGKLDDTPAYDENDRPLSKLIVSWIALAAPWQLTTDQLLQTQGLNITSNRIYAVKHKQTKFWQLVNKAEINGEIYEIAAINQDSDNFPTSYDLVTLKEVKKHG